MMVAPARRLRPSRSLRPRTRRWGRVGRGIRWLVGFRAVPGLKIETWGTRFNRWIGFFDDEVDDFGLADVEAGLRFEHFAHFDAIELLVALGAGAPDGGTARGVEQAELDADGVGDFAHDAAERVDFADEMALGDAADGGVAAHLGDEIEVHGDERGLEAHARGGHCGFAAGVTGAHDDDIVLFGERHPVLFYG